MAYKRFFARMENHHWKLEIFSVINYIEDVDEICAKIEGDPTLRWESETLGSGIIRSKPLSLKLNLRLVAGSFDLYTAYLVNDGNYDGIYSSVPGLDLIYARVQDLTRSRTFYLVLSEDSYDLNYSGSGDTLTLIFTDGIERAKNLTQYLNDGFTLNSSWLSKFTHWTYSTTSRTVSTISDKKITVSSYWGGIAVGQQIRIGSSTGRTYLIEEVGPGATEIRLDKTCTALVGDTVYLGTAPTTYLTLQSLFQKAIEDYSTLMKNLAPHFNSTKPLTSAASHNHSRSSSKNQLNKSSVVIKGAKLNNMMVLN
jgi:hypothetical protein